jgi:hypothetical protein
MKAGQTTNKEDGMNKNNLRALKHTNKKELMELVESIKTDLLMLTGNGMTWTEKKIEGKLNEFLQPLYFK